MSHLHKVILMDYLRLVAISRVIPAFYLLLPTMLFLMGRHGIRHLQPFSGGHRPQPAGQVCRRVWGVGPREKTSEFRRSQGNDYAARVDRDGVYLQSSGTVTVEEQCIPERIRPEAGGPGRNLRTEKEAGSAPGAIRPSIRFYVDGKKFGFSTDKGVVADRVKENIGCKDKIVTERYSM